MRIESLPKCQHLHSNSKAICSHSSTIIMDCIWLNHFVSFFLCSFDVNRRNSLHIQPQYSLFYTCVSSRARPHLHLLFIWYHDNNPCFCLSPFRHRKQVPYQNMIKNMTCIKTTNQILFGEISIDCIVESNYSNSKRNLLIDYELYVRL